mgnify:CR=1 FL=1
MAKRKPPEPHVWDEVDDLRLRIREDLTDLERDCRALDYWRVADQIAFVRRMAQAEIVGGFGGCKIKEAGR